MCSDVASQQQTHREAPDGGCRCDEALSFCELVRQRWRYCLDHMATLTLIVVAIRWTDHRLSLMGTNVKQLGFAPAQLVQKPAGLSFQVPDFAGLPAELMPPAETMGSRKALPSGVKVILNFVPLGVAAMNGWPLKNVVLMSFGRIASAARATVGIKPKARTAVRKSITPLRASASEKRSIIGSSAVNYRSRARQFAQADANRNNAIWGSSH